MSSTNVKASITLGTLTALKAKGERFACVTAYDATFTEIASSAGIEVVLVGDSLGMVIQYRAVAHARAPARGAEHIGAAAH